MKASYLVLDYGTTALKAAAYDEDFNRLGVCSRAWDYLRPAPGRIECPPGQYIDKATSALLELSRLAGGFEQVRAVSVTGQAETLVLLDPKEEPLGNAVVWLDTRAEAECRRMRERFDVKQFYQRTGNTDFDPIMPLHKLEWLREHDGGRFDRARHLLLLKDFAIHWLSGQIVTEHTVNCCSGYFDIVRKDWDDELLTAAGIPRDRLPPLAPSQHVVGKIAQETARLLGIREDAAIVNGLLDQCASALGAGNTEEGRICETTGTVLAVAATLDSFNPAPGMQPVLTFCHALPEKYLALPNCSTAGVLLDWYADTFLSPAEREGRSFVMIDEQVAERVGKPSSLVLLPHFAGRLSPVNCPEAVGVLYGLKLDTDRFDIARAIMESVAFMLRENLELLQASGIDAEEIISLGGASRSGVWMQMKADTLNKPMFTMEDEESTALGCAMNAAMALGALRPEEAPLKTKRKAAFQPDETRKALYDALYGEYERLNRLLLFE